MVQFIRFLNCSDVQSGNFNHRPFKVYLVYADDNLENSNDKKKAKESLLGLLRRLALACVALVNHNLHSTSQFTKPCSQRLQRPPPCAGGGVGGVREALLKTYPREGIKLNN